MRSTLLVLLLLQGATTLGERKPPSPSRAAFEYEVQPVHTETGWALSVTITNPSRQPLTVFLDSLPWEATEATILVAVTADRKQTHLEESFPVDDVASDTVDIRPGESRRGQILLAWRLPSLEATLRRGPVVLFWSFQVRLSDGRKLDRQSGAVLLAGPPGSA